jgi:hypothetical protein
MVVPIRSLAHVLRVLVLMQCEGEQLEKPNVRNGQGLCSYCLDVPLQCLLEMIADNPYCEYKQVDDSQYSVFL